MASEAKQHTLKDSSRGRGLAASYGYPTEVRSQVQSSPAGASRTLGAKTELDDQDYSLSVSDLNQSNNMSSNNARSSGPHNYR